MAKLGKAVGVFSEGIAQDAGQSEDPVAVRDGEADIVADEGGGVDGTSLMATGATAPSLTGKRK